MSTTEASRYLDQLVASTRARIEPGALFDQMAKSKPALDLFKEKMKSGSGLYLLRHLHHGAGDVDAAPADDAGSYDTERTGDVLAAAKFEWSAFITDSVRLKRRDIELNSGSQTQLQSIANAAVARVVESHSAKLDKLLHGSHPHQASYGVCGFEQLIGTGPLGGIDPSVAGFEFWKSTVRTVDPADMPITAAFREMMLDIEDACGGQAKPDVALVGRNIFRAYQDSLSEAARAMLAAQAGTIDSEFAEFRHDGVLIRYDGALDADTAFFINKDDLGAEHLNDLFLKDEGDRPLEGKLETVRPWVSSVAFSVGARNKHGKLIYKAPAVETDPEA